MGSRHGLAIFHQTLQVHFDGCVHVRFSLAARASRGHASRQVRRVRGVVVLRLFNDDKKTVHGHFTFRFRPGYED